MVARRIAEQHVVHIDENKYIGAAAHARFEHDPSHLRLAAAALAGGQMQWQVIGKFGERCMRRDQTVDRRDQTRLVAARGGTDAGHERRQVTAPGFIQRGAKGYSSHR